jgi:glycosyltransferase involved in cell wall biosynthesis
VNLIQNIERPGFGQGQGAALPRRVALVSEWCFPRRGGIESQILGLAKALQARGVEATIITPYPGPQEIEGIRVDRVDCLRLPFFELSVSPRLIPVIAGRLAAGRYDLVHVQPSIVAPFCFAAAPAAHALGLPVVMTFHSVMDMLPRLLRQLSRWTGWYDGRVTMAAVSTVIAGQLKRAFPDHPVHILPNGFDRDFWAAPGPPREKDGVLRIVTALRVGPRKRPVALVDMFSEARREAARRGLLLELVIAGDGSQRKRIERQIARLGLQDSVVLGGWRTPEELRDLYRRSDLFVVPSIKESFCIAALEARAAGLPVLARMGTGVRDYISNGLTGLLVNSDAEMIRKIVDLAADRTRLDMLAGAPVDFLRYDWSTVAEQHLALYRSMIQPHCQPVNS